MPTIKICTSCGYTWEPRVEHPKACPECRARLAPQERRATEEAYAREQTDHMDLLGHTDLEE